MSINPEKKSLEISFEQVPDVSSIWIRLPMELIYSEEEKFHIFIDGAEQEYDLVKYQKDVRIGFLLDKNSEKVEIVGTKVIPEFSTLAILIFAAAIITVMYIMRSSGVISSPLGIPRKSTAN